MIKDKIIENAKWTITKYDVDGNLYERNEIDGNCLLNEGINNLTELIGSAGGTGWDNSTAYLGTGDSGIAETASDTGLKGTAVYQSMESGYPTYGTNQKITWKASFASDEANQDWREFTVGTDSTNASAINLNRKTDNQGTKAVGQTWELELEITFS